MNKYLSRITTFLLVTFSISTITLAAQQYTIYVNGNKLDGKVIVQDGTTYVPLRALTEALDCNVDVKNGVINVSNTTHSATATMIETQQPSSPSQPSQPITPPTEQTAPTSDSLTQQEMLDCFNRMVELGKGRDGAFKGCEVTLLNYSFPEKNKMLASYTVDGNGKFIKITDKLIFNKVNEARVFAKGGLINEYCGFMVRGEFYEETNKPSVKHTEMIIKDENGNWIFNPDY